jgi:hypothetical protein
MVPTIKMEGPTELTEQDLLHEEEGKEESDDDF